MREKRGGMTDPIRAEVDAYRAEAQAFRAEVLAEVRSYRAEVGAWRAEVGAWRAEDRAHFERLETRMDRMDEDLHLITRIVMELRDRQNGGNEGGQQPSA